MRTLFYYNKIYESRRGKKTMIPPGFTVSPLSRGIPEGQGGSFETLSGYELSGPGE